MKQEGRHKTYAALMIIRVARYENHITSKSKLPCGYHAATGDESIRPLPFHAVQNDLSDLRWFLLTHNVSTDIPLDRGKTTLKTAVMHSSIEVVWGFLGHGGIPAIDDGLIHGAGHGRLDVAGLLLDRGAAANALPKRL